MPDRGTVAVNFRTRSFPGPKCPIDVPFMAPFIRGMYIRGILVSRINSNSVAYEGFRWRLDYDVDRVVDLIVMV